jgi:hypothetical protein
MRAQLGRPMRRRRHRCTLRVRQSDGRRDGAAAPDGTPFPTFYYLTHPGATAAMSALEAGT